MPFRTTLAAVLLAWASAPAAPVPKAESGGALLVGTSDGTLRILAPDGKEMRKLDPQDGDGRLALARLSPDGKRVVVASRPDGKKLTVAVAVRAVATGETKPLADLEHLDRLFWSADGATVYASGLDLTAANDPNKKRHECWVNRAIDATTGKVTPLDLGGEYRVAGLTADGTSFVTLRTFGQRAVGNGVWGPELESHLTDRATLKHTKLVGADAALTPLAPFPDGKRWLVQVEGGGKPWVRVYTPADKTLSELPDWTDGGVMSRTIRLSPDGKRLAFVRLAGPPDARRWELVVAGADGAGPKVLFETRPPLTIPAVDWR